VRYRELEQILPQLVSRGIHIQLVTSAFRPIPAHWAEVPRLNLVVSVDGLQPEHDVRRKPATYDRILKNIAGQHASIHCTATAQMLQRPGYIEDFLKFWTPRPEAKRVWFSILRHRWATRCRRSLRRSSVPGWFRNCCGFRSSTRSWTCALRSYASTRVRQHRRGSVSLRGLPQQCRPI
jgi:hypothetical protein